MQYLKNGKLFLKTDFRSEFCMVDLGIRRKEIFKNLKDAKSQVSRCCTIIQKKNIDKYLCLKNSQVKVELYYFLLYIFRNA